jgi:hypothetical protein
MGACVLMIFISQLMLAGPTPGVTAETATRVLLAQKFECGLAEREPMGWFAIRTGDGRCVVTRSYAVSPPQSFRIGSTPYWDGLYGYGFGTPAGNIVRVAARVLCDVSGPARPFLGVVVAGRFYSVILDPERGGLRWSNGDAHWSMAGNLVIGSWNTLCLDIDIHRGLARCGVNGRVVLDNCAGSAVPDYARQTESIYIGTLAGASSVSYFDDITVVELSQTSFAMVSPAIPYAPHSGGQAARHHTMTPRRPNAKAQGAACVCAEHEKRGGECGCTDRNDKQRARKERKSKRQQ